MNPFPILERGIPEKIPYNCRITYIILARKAVVYFLFLLTHCWPEESFNGTKEASSTPIHRVTYSMTTTCCACFNYSKHYEKYRL